VYRTLSLEKRIGFTPGEYLNQEAEGVYEDANFMQKYL
jgi:hypothetical protein